MALSRSELAAVVFAMFVLGVIGGFVAGVHHPLRVVAAAPAPVAPGRAIKKGEPVLHLLASWDPRTHVWCFTNVEENAGTFSAPFCIPDPDFATTVRPMQEPPHADPREHPRGGGL